MSTRSLFKHSISKDEAGSVGIIFGLTFIPVLFLAGAGVDFSRYATQRSNLQEATDAAVLKAAATMTNTTTNDQAKAQVQVLMRTDRTLGSATVSTASISADKQTFCATSSMQMSTSFLKLTGLSTMTSSARACANLAGGVDPNTTYEIALVLDNSGSMTGTTSGTTKLGALKSAATSFITTMFTKAPSKVQFSITPFAGAVVAVDPSVTANRSLSWIDTAGNNSQHWIAFGGKTAANAAGFNNRFDIFAKLKQRNSNMDWRGCFEAPTYPKNVQDIDIVASDAETLFVPYLAPDEPSGYDNNNYIDDNGGVTANKQTTYTCSDTASGDWNKLSRACKYKPTASKSGSYGPTAFFGPSAFCPDSSTQTMLQLTSTQTTINNKINQLVANGNTNLHEGFMWGWRTLSPKGPFGAARAYSAEKNRKIMVFMTDGFNNWGAYPGTVVGSDYEALGYYTYNGAKNIRLPNGAAGDKVNYQTALQAAANSSSSYLSTSRKAEDNLTLEACTNAKAAGIEVFTIGFSTSTDPIDAQGLALLKSCATNAEHYYAVEDASQLNAAFSQIGIGLSKLRLSE